MKTKLNLFAMFLGAMLLALPDVVNAQFIFTTNNGAITITGYTGDTTMVIPATINGLPVTGLGENAFADIPWLRSVSIPNSVTNIANSAFTASLNLTDISVAADNPAYSSINRSLFDKAAHTLLQYAIGLTNGTYSIPASVTTIGTNAFFDCANLTRVTIGGNVANIAAYAFGNCTSLTNVTIPNGVTNIGIYAFGYCTSLPQVTIPNSVTSIGVEAFGICYGLTNVTLSTNLTSLADYAFEFCTNLASVTIPNSVTNIGNMAFYSCISLFHITNGVNVRSIGDYAFYGCPHVIGIYFQGNAPSLGSAVFYNDNFSTVYYLPGTSGWSSPFGGRPAVMLNSPNPAGSVQVTLSPATAITAGAQWQVDGGVAQPSGAIVPGLSVGNHTVSFSGANGWAMPASQSVAVSANSTATASGTFFQLAYTTNNGAITLTGYYGFGGALVLPSTINGLPVTRIGDYAFHLWDSLTSMTIPDSVTNIGNAAFQDSWLTNVIIGNGVTSIGTNAFYRCYGLANVTFGTNLTIIEDYAFDQCLGISKVIIPDSVTRIGWWAFYHCINLTNVMIGHSVTNIGEDAFYDCSHLTGIYFQGNAPSLAPEPFNNDKILTVYYLPWTKGWGAPGAWFGGRPTALWPPQMQTSNARFGVGSNPFGFNIAWAGNAVVVVEACTNLAHRVWTPVGTNTLNGGTADFSDPQWPNYPVRFYRLRSP